MREKFGSYVRENIWHIAGGFYMNGKERIIKRIAAFSCHPETELSAVRWRLENNFTHAGLEQYHFTQALIEGRVDKRSKNMLQLKPYDRHDFKTPAEQEEEKERHHASLRRAEGCGLLFCMFLLALGMIIYGVFIKPRMR